MQYISRYKCKTLSGCTSVHSCKLDDLTYYICIAVKPMYLDFVDILYIGISNDSIDNENILNEMMALIMSNNIYFTVY